MSAPEGLLLIDKPAGITSHGVVQQLRRNLGTRKIGHAGTLDPMATGLLVVCIGRATRLLRYLSGLDKSYEGTGRLGVETDTLDAEGDVVRIHDVDVTLADLRLAAAEFAGEIEQVPPAHSAVKVGGEPLYKAARRGEAKPAPPRRVRIDRFEIGGLHGRDFDFTAECSGGTYIRTLVADVGTRLGCGAHLIRLRRTRVGPFSLDEARSLDDPSPPAPLERAVDHLPRHELSADEAAAASHGSILAPAGIAGPYGVYGPDGRLVAMYRDDGTKARPEMVLAPQG